MRIYKKYDNGIYRVREIFGIKITTKPLENKLENKINNLFGVINKLEKKIDLLDLRDKARMQILALGDKKIIEEKRKERLIVSLTTFPQRIYDIDVVLFSLLNQTVKPDKIILWLSVEEFPNLEEDIPTYILNMKKFGIEIEFCNNLYSYNKLIYSLKKYPNDVIVTADDDIYYTYDWLEKLYNAYLENSNCIHCHRAHKILFDKNNNILPYKKWDLQVPSINTEPSYINFFTGVGGVLYKYNFLYKDIFNKDLFMKLCQKNDDIWFWAMAVLNNTKINVVKDNIYLLNEIGYPNYRRLYNLNVLKEINDIQLNNIFNHYGNLLKDKIINN